MQVMKQDKSVWRIVRFGEVVREVTETEPNPLANGITRYVGLSDLDPDSIQLKRWGNLEGADITFTRLFHKGQMLFARRRAYQRKAALAPFDGICSGDIIVMEARPDKLLPELLPFLIHTDGFFNYALQTSAGSLSPRTKWLHLAKYEFALPPLDEQHRIVEILTAVEETLESQKRLVNAIEKVANIMRYYYFSANWQEKELGKLFHVQLGKMLSKKAKHGKSPRPYLANTNVQWGYMDLSEVREMDFNDAEFKKFKLQVGDMLVCEGGEVGRSAIWEGQIEDCCYQKALHRLRTKNGELQTELLLQFMYFANHKGYFAALTGHSTIAHLTMVKLKELRIPVPPESVQMEIINIFKQLENTAKVATTKVERTVDLKKSLLSQFIG